MKKEKFCAFFKIWRANVLSMIPMNLLYSIMTLTLIPYGLASVGMTNVTIDLARQRYYLSITDYFDAIKKHWKQALGAGLVNLLITALLVFATLFYYSAASLLAALGLGLSLLTMMIFSFMKYYVWPQIIMFRMPLRSVYQNAFIFAFMNLKTNLLIGFVSLLCYALAMLMLLYVPYLLSVVLFVLAGTCFFPGFKHLLVQYLVFPFLKENMIDPYYAEHPNEDVHERSNLGI